MKNIIFNVGNLHTNELYVDGIKVPIKDSFCNLQLAEGVHKIKIQQNKKNKIKIILSLISILLGELISGSSVDFEELLKIIEESFWVFEIKVNSDDTVVFQDGYIISQTGITEILQSARLNKVSNINSMLFMLVYCSPLLLLFTFFIVVLAVVSFKMILNGWIKEAVLILICDVSVIAISVYVLKHSKIARKLKKIMQEK